ncbi:MAG TPA: ribosome silencing factor [Pyrinomonadaceae bacterium]|jgi:ribosome-associated protein|nr:ribosome silencing factor [Pyrinomonadaceae bacterium]
MTPDEQQREEATPRATKRGAGGDAAKTQPADEGVSARSGGANPVAPPGAAKEPLDEFVVAALRAADDKKALDLVVLDVGEVASFTDYFLIATGTNARQVQAISDEVVERLKKNGRRPARVEGYRGAEWVLLDYGDFVFHVFEEKARRFYDLERLWRDAGRVALPPGVTATPAPAAGERA